MKKVILLFIFCTGGLVWAATFPAAETRTIGNDTFEFPSQALENGPALFAIALSESRSNGEVQQQMLLDWHEDLLQVSRSIPAMSVYHFSVIQSPPRFVQGIIRRAIGKFYKETVKDDHAVVLFIDDINAFAFKAGFPVDADPTIALVDRSGEVVGYIKGENSRANIEKLREIVSTLP